MVRKHCGDETEGRRAREAARRGPPAEQRPACRPAAIPHVAAGCSVERCATCHRLRGEGETIGPDLTFANRKDRDFLLVSLVDPSGAVRKEYQASQLATRDGRILIGLIVERAVARGRYVLRDAEGPADSGSHGRTSKRH